MPIYTFCCNECKKKFDKYYSKPVGEAIETCECGASAKKIIAPFGMRFIGIGFAHNDELVEKEYKRVTEETSNMYEKRAEMTGGPKLSENTELWNDLAKVVGD
jgi:putative FmdB family regulatory protein